MAAGTPRSATTAHKRMRRIVLATAQAQGITHCPSCKVALDYVSRTRPPNAAEADEIIPFAVTGVTSQDPDDWQVLCRTCNARKGDKVASNGEAHANPYPHSRSW